MRTLRLQHRKRKDVPWFTASTTKKPAPGLGRRGAKARLLWEETAVKVVLQVRPTKRRDGCPQFMDGPKASLAPTSCVLRGHWPETFRKAGYPGGGDVVDPCRACDRRNSGAGPVSGKKIPTLSRVGYRTMRGQQERRCATVPARGKSPRTRIRQARGKPARSGWGLLQRAGCVAILHAIMMSISAYEKGRPKPPSLPSHERGEVG